MKFVSDRLPLNNGQTTRCAAVTEQIGNQEQLIRFDFCASTKSRYYAAVALGIWCANWETGVAALNKRGHFAALYPRHYISLTPYIIAAIAFLGVFVTAWIAFKTNNKNLLIKTVTDERAKWRSELKCPEKGGRFILYFLVLLERITKMYGIDESEFRWRSKMTKQSEARVVFFYSAVRLLRVSGKDVEKMLNMGRSAVSQAV